MKYKIIQESFIDATSFIENLVRSEIMLKEYDQSSPQSSHQSTPQSSAQQSLEQSLELSLQLSQETVDFYLDIFIQDQFGQVYQAISQDQYMNKKSLQNLNYFLIRKYVYKKNFNSELLAAICESIHHPISISIVIKNKSIIYAYNQKKDKIRVWKNKKILRSMKINRDPKNNFYINVLLYCSKYLVVIGSFLGHNNSLIFINQYTGRCEQLIEIKNIFLTPDQIATAISNNYEFLYISPQLYQIESLSKLKEFLQIKISYPQFSLDSSKLFGFDKESSKILIVSIKHKNYAKIHKILYDFSDSLDRPSQINNNSLKKLALSSLIFLVIFQNKQKSLGLRDLFSPIIYFLLEQNLNFIYCII